VYKYFHVFYRMLDADVSGLYYLYINLFKVHFRISTVTKFLGFVLIVCYADVHSILYYTVHLSKFRPPPVKFGEVKR